MLWWHTSSHSYKILAVVVVAYLANMASQGLVAQVFALSTSDLLGHWQIWRFFTYPFAIGGTSTILVSSFVFYNLAPEIEDIIGKQRFGLIVFVFVLLHGFVYAGIFAGRDALLGGTDALALALVTIYTYVYPKSEISVLGFFTLRTWLMALLLGGIAIFPPLLRAFGSPIAVIGVMSNQIFGVFSGLLFSQIYFEKYTLSKRSSSSTLFKSEDSNVVSKSVASRAQRADASSLASALHTPSASHDEDNSLDEHHLNVILDKINESGQKSLTAEEKEFLRRYADKL